MGEPVALIPRAKETCRRAQLEPKRSPRTERLHLGFHSYLTQAAFIPVAHAR